MKTHRPSRPHGPGLKKKQLAARLRWYRRRFTQTAPRRPRLLPKLLPWRCLCEMPKVLSKIRTQRKRDKR